MFGVCYGFGRCRGRDILGLGMVYNGRITVAQLLHTHKPSEFITIPPSVLQWGHFLAMCVFSSPCLMICFLSVRRSCLQVQTHRDWLTGIISPVRKVLWGKTCRRFLEVG